MPPGPGPGAQREGMTAASGPAAPKDTRYLGQPTAQRHPQPRSGSVSPQLAIVGGRPPRIKDAHGAACGGRASGPVLDPERPPAQYGSYAEKQDQQGQYPTPANRYPTAKPQVLLGLTPARSFRDDRTRPSGEFGSSQVGGGAGEPIRWWPFEKVPGEDRVDGRRRCHRGRISHRSLTN